MKNMVRPVVVDDRLHERKIAYVTPDVSAISGNAYNVCAKSVLKECGQKPSVLSVGAKD